MVKWIKVVLVLFVVAVIIAVLVKVASELISEAIARFSAASSTEAEIQKTDSAISNIHSEIEMALENAIGDLEWLKAFYRGRSEVKIKKAEAFAVEAENLLDSLKKESGGKEIGDRLNSFQKRFSSFVESCNQEYLKEERKVPVPQMKVRIVFEANLNNGGAV